MSRAILRFCNRLNENLVFQRHGLVVRNILYKTHHGTGGHSPLYPVSASTLCHRYSHQTSDSLILRRLTARTHCSLCGSTGVQNTARQSRQVQRQPHRSYAVMAEDGWIMRVLGEFGYTGKLKHKKYRLKIGGLRLYLCCVELIEYDQFFKEFELPDTFNSWFRITELHIWLMMVRLAQEGKEGKFVVNRMVAHLWTDVDTRSKKLGEMAGMVARKQAIGGIADQFKASLFAYDEGLLGHDRVLACAVWRTFFEKSCDDPEKIELLVQYIRKQTVHLEQQASRVLLTSGFASFLPLHGDTLDQERTRGILNYIYERA